MKVPVLILTIFMAAVVSAGQVTTAKDDISAEKYFAAENKAAELLKTANYRSISSTAHYEKPPTDGKLLERRLKEVIQPDKWRTVEVIFGDKPSHEERVWVDKALYVKRNDGPWQKYSGGGSGGGSYEGGQVKNQYRYLSEVDLAGKKAELYELISIRTANKYYSQTEFKTVRYIRTTRIWYSDGKILKKNVETAIEGLPEMLLEVTTYEYDPKDLKIEAPIK